jgi:small-conductance mechanosensitive channel
MVKPSEQWAAAGELRRRLLVAFEDAGIEIPFPHRVVIARSEGSTGPDSGPVAGADGAPGDASGPLPGGEQEPSRGKSRDLP